MKNQVNNCNATVEIINKKDAILKFERGEECSTCSKCKFTYGGNVSTVRAKNTANAKIGDKVTFSATSGKLMPYIKITCFMPLLFLLAGFLFALKFDTDVKQLIFAASVFVAGSLISLIAMFILKRCNATKFEVIEVNEPLVENNTLVEETTVSTQETETMSEEGEKVSEDGND